MKNSESVRKKEAVWIIIQTHHARSRYVWELYNQNRITKEVYDYCADERLIDLKLIAKWKKQGYESLCCLQCITASNTNFGSMCVCRVPKDQRDSEKIVRCTNCGCTGCSH